MATQGSSSPFLKNQSRHRRDPPDSHHQQQQLAPTSSASSPALHHPSTPFSSSTTFSKDAIPRPAQPNSLKTLSISSKEHHHLLDPKLLQSHSLASSSSHLSNTAVFGGLTKTGSVHQNNMGEVHLKLWYSMDEISPSVHYQPLYLNLIRSLNVTPHSDSLISLVQKYWPADIDNLANPFMKIYLHTNQIRPFFRMICSQYVLTCNDVNTLFRGQSLASKVMYEMMKFVGYKYLVVSLEPLIDLIFAERKSCEIDPSRIKSGDSIGQNFCNITTYVELAFNRVVESVPHCPQALREIFAELRQVMEQYYPGREDVARLALSSFLILRFFAAAILNPKLFALKLETPDIEVSRTLMLISKILQRLTNCVVSANPLTNKEEWLTPVLQRFSDGSHKIAMIRFLDDISTIDTDENNHPEPMDTVNDENISPVHSSEQAILKSGFLIERQNGPVKKRSFKNFFHPKRRLVVLTGSMLNWQKGGSVKDTSTISSALSSAIVSNPMSRDHNANAEQKGQIAISDVTSVSVLADAKNSFRVTTMSTEVHFQASNENDMNEWIIMIQVQQRRMALNNGSSSKFPIHTSSTAHRAIVEVDLDRELHTVFKHLSDHLDVLCDHGWCCRYRCTRCERGCVKERQPTEEDNSEPMVVTDPIQRTNTTPS